MSLTVEGANPIRAPISASVNPVLRSSVIREAHVTMALTLRHPVVESLRHPPTAFRDTTGMGPESFGERLKRLRLEAGLGRPELAERAGVPYSTLAEIENTGKESTRAEYLVALADALGVSARELAVGQKMHEATGVHLTLAEGALVRAYRAASASERKQIQAYLEGLAARPTRTKRRGADPLAEAGRKPPIPTR